jgi:DNA mismatch repair protein MutS2
VKQTLDLLYETPQTRISLQTLAGALPYAFSAGDTGDLFRKVLDSATLGPTCFDASCFAGDLFLDDLLGRCMKVRIAGSEQKLAQSYLRRVLCCSPQTPSTTLMRQGMLGELAQNPGLRERFEALYLELRRLRRWLDGDGLRIRLELNQRRIDILRSLHTAFGLMDEGFLECQSELLRLHQFAHRVRASSQYQRLDQLLTYENNLATLDLRVQVGIDGRMRGFKLVDFEEDLENPYHTGWLARWWSKLVALARGYRFSEQELIVRLTDEVFEGIQEYVLQLFQLLGDMEFYLVGLSFLDLAQRNNFRVCFPEFAEATGGSGLQLEQLFNPLLLVEGVVVKSCDLRTSPERSMLVITGPNSGGKTRLLQAVALTQLLGQAGLMVPARKAQLVWTRGLFVSILADVGANQQEGRLGMELLRIRRLFERIKPGDVVVLDELCSGTNPSEGEEIFRLVVGLLAELKPQLFLTTHFLQLAQQLQAEREPSLDFLQVELCEGEPTYQFIPGVAQTSLASRTAARLGVTAQELASLVKRAIAHDASDFTPSNPSTREPRAAQLVNDVTVIR